MSLVRVNKSANVYALSPNAMIYFPNYTYREFWQTIGEILRSVRESYRRRSSQFQPIIEATGTRSSLKSYNVGAGTQVRRIWPYFDLCLCAEFEDGNFGIIFSAQLFMSYTLNGALY